MRRFLVALVVCGLSWTAHAQVPIVCETDCRVRVGEPFIAFTETTANVQQYRLLVNGAAVNLVPLFFNGHVQFQFAQGLPTVGVYTLVVEATLNDGRIVYTEPVSLSIVRRRVRIKSP